MGYDPDNRIQYMAGYGHYKNANALALGVGYLPSRQSIIQEQQVLSPLIGLYFNSNWNLASSTLRSI